MSGAIYHTAATLQAMSILATALQDMREEQPTQLALAAVKKLVQSIESPQAKPPSPTVGKAVFYFIAAMVAAVASVCSSRACAHAPAQPAGSAQTSSRPQE